MNRPLRVVACLLTLAVSGCDSRREPQPQSPALPQVSLPDLAQADKAVQQQIGDRYRALQSLIEKRAAAPELARAYGDVGNLLMAADYLEAAEAKFGRSQELLHGD